MIKFRETITALAYGDYPGAVRIDRREHEPINNERFILILKCSIRVTTIAAATALFIIADIWKLIAIFFFTILFGLFYYGIKD